MDSQRKEIGGYFSLELPYVAPFVDTLYGQDEGSGVCLVNSGRNALYLILKSAPQIRKIHIPYYTCDAVAQACDAAEVQIARYDVNSELFPIALPNLQAEEAFLFTNYFGLYDDRISSLYQKYGDRLIVDNTQALFCKLPAGCKGFYSPRKFVGIPDGGIAMGIDSALDMSIDSSWRRASHLLRRIDEGASAGYQDFKNNSAIIASAELCRISNLSRRLLDSIDWDEVRSARCRNFKILHSMIGKYNRLDIPNFSGFAVPMVYPFVTDRRDLRKILIDNGVFVATYWPELYDDKPENLKARNISESLLPLPIDQRYGDAEMSYIANILLEYV